MRPRHCRLWLLNATTPHELHCLLSDNVIVQQRPNRVWYTQARDLAERAVGFVSNNHGDRVGGKGAEAQTFPGLTGLTGGKPPHTCLIVDCLRLGMVRTVCSRAALRHTPVRSTHPAIRGNRGHKENKRKQAEKQAG